MQQVDHQNFACFYMLGRLNEIEIHGEDEDGGGGEGRREMIG